MDIKQEKNLRSSVPITFNAPKELPRITEPYLCQITGPSLTTIHIETRSTLLSGTHNILTDESGNGSFIIDPLLRMTRGPIVVTASYENESVATTINLT